MRMLAALLAIAALAAVGCPVYAGLTAEQIKALPAPASHSVDFHTEIQPIFEASCIKCHGRGRNKGGLQIDSRQTLLKGGDSGPAILPGNSAQSYLIALVAGVDPDELMPKKGTRLTAQQIGLLRAWIDQGAPWDARISFARAEPLNLHSHLPIVPAGRGEPNPVDRFLDAYFAAHGVPERPVVEDRVFARRAYLDIVGLLPPGKELKSFVADKHKDKRQRLVALLLADNRAYAENWLSFWNDLLRNDYKGTGYIDGGRQPITKWLYGALLSNSPYDQFVRQLISPEPVSEGFIKGIVWRGVVNASQTPQMQAAQNISQVFLGVNLKCASCHDSFINDWQLADSYGLARIYSDEPLEMFLCDKPTGRMAEAKFLYPQVGQVSWTTNRQQRLQQLAGLITCPQDGRLSRTIVNRLWAKFIGRGLVEPLDDMEQPAWQSDLLDWLAEDLVAHHYDLKQPIERILTSRAYQLPAVNSAEIKPANYVFAGPEIRRMTAEQFCDALAALTGAGYSKLDAADIPLSPALKARFAPARPAKWIWNDAAAATNAKVGTIYLRKTISLPQVPALAQAFVMCDDAFTLLVNGHTAASGTNNGQFVLADLQPWLKRGPNLIALQAQHLPPKNAKAQADKSQAEGPNPAGLFFYARLRAEPPGRLIGMDFASDSSWLVSDQRIDHWQDRELDDQHWRPATELGDSAIAPWNLSEDVVARAFFAADGAPFRAALVAADPLMVAMGRPNRDQVVTSRSATATTLQALELTNGKTLSQMLESGGARLIEQNPDRFALVRAVYQQALGRRPTQDELTLAAQLLGPKPQPDQIADFLWAMVMLPEYQLIY